MSQFIEMFGDTHMRSDHSRQWKEVVEIINGKDYKSIQVEDGGYPVYGTGGEMARASDYLSPANSILLGRKGTIDKPLLIREKYWNVDTAFGAVPDEKVLHYVYFYWHCKTIDFNVLNKGTTLPSTTKVDLLNLWIKIPSMEEQTRFGSIVEQADKSEFVGCKSQFIEMFKGDNQVPLGDICNIEKGATITRNDVLPGEVPVVAGGQEPSCYHNVANREAGAITVSASGAYAGYINFWNCPIFASDCNTIISKDDEKTDQTFVYFGLRAMQKQIYGLQKGGAQPHVYGKDLQKFMFPCPSYAKQIEFSKMAKQADKSEYYN